MIKLVRPSKEIKEKVLSFKKDFLDNNESVINGSELLDKTEDFDQWLAAVTANTNPETVNPAWVLTDTFFAVDDTEKIVGIIDLRHTLNDFLKDCGHCGYSVRPSERKKGYATEMLKQLKIFAKDSGMENLQLAVERSNEASVKTILKNGGVYERTFEFENQPADVYRIAL